MPKSRTPAPRVVDPAVQPRLAKIEAAEARAKAALTALAEKRRALIEETVCGYVVISDNNEEKHTLHAISRDVALHIHGMSIICSQSGGRLEVTVHAAGVDFREFVRMNSRDGYNVFAGNVIDNSIYHYWLYAFSTRERADKCLAVLLKQEADDTAWLNSKD